MDRNELIEKAKEFWAERANQPAGKSSTRAEAMADFVLSLETKDEKVGEWWKDGYWTVCDDGERFDSGWDDCLVDKYRLASGLVFRTKEEAEHYSRQRIARTAIHRWIEEKAEKVDWDCPDTQKWFPLWDYEDKDWTKDWYSQMGIPDWFYVYERDYDRLMSENAAHFEVLKEGE